MQQQSRGSSSSSRKEVQAAYQEEQQVCQAFNLKHFYDRKRLNLTELKTRINQFKRTKKEQKNKKSNKDIHSSPINGFENNLITGKFGVASRKMEGTSIMKAKKQIKMGFDRTISTYSQPHSHRRKEQIIKSSQWPRQQVTKPHQLQTNWDIKSRTLYRPPTQTSKVSLTRYTEHRKRTKTIAHDKQQNSKCSQSSLRHSFQEPNFQGKINATTQGEVSQIQNRILFLWSHYQLVTEILLELKDETNRQRHNIKKYRQMVCTRQFQFTKDLLDDIIKDLKGSSQIVFAKRLKKVLVLSRVFETLGILYVSLFLCFDKPSNSYLTNLIGYATSSIAFVIRLITLIYHLEDPLNFNLQTYNILEAIGDFQRGTYGNRIGKISQLTLRLEQNNEVSAIVQGKLCLQMDSSFQETVSSFLKNIDLESKAFHQYSVYLFEFLSFHLASFNLLAPFPQIQVPPAPYFSFFPKKRTLVIEPWGVLYSRKAKTTYLRAHSLQFLDELAKYWNLVYWSQLMPNQIDDLLERLPPGKWLYRYHCQNNQRNLFKDVNRIGCDVENTLFIDKSQSMFRANNEIGLVFPWRAQRKDTKLIQLLELLQPLLANDQLSLRTYISSNKSKISSGNIRRRTPQKAPIYRSKPILGEQQAYPQKLAIFE